MLFTTHENNIPHIRACVNAYTEVWVHGNGDVFPVFTYDPAKPTEQDGSKIAAENFNKGFEHIGYRVKINKNNMPKNKAQLDAMLLQAQAMEESIRRRQPMGDGKVKNVIITDADVYEPAGDIDYSQYTRKPEEQ